MQHLQTLTHINNLPKWLTIKKWNGRLKRYETIKQQPITDKQAFLLNEYAKGKQQVAELYLYQFGDCNIYSASADLVHYLETVKQYPAPPTIDESNINIIEQ